MRSLEMDGPSDKSARVSTPVENEELVKLLFTGNANTFSINDFYSLERPDIACLALF